MFTARDSLSYISTAHYHAWTCWWSLCHTLQLRQYCQSPLSRKKRHGTACSCRYMPRWTVVRTISTTNSIADVHRLVSDMKTSTVNSVAIIVSFGCMPLSWRRIGMAWLMCWCYSYHKTQQQLVGPHDYFRNRTDWPETMYMLRQASVGEEDPRMRHGPTVSIGNALKPLGYMHLVPNTS